MTIIKSELGAFTGRLFYTGTPAKFVNTFIGKNTISSVPKEVASLLNKENPSSYTFHSLRRSSATAAADAGASVQQLMDFRKAEKVVIFENFSGTISNFNM